MQGRMAEAEEQYRHALAVLDFVYDDAIREYLEVGVVLNLANILLDDATGRYEEVGALILRIRKPAQVLKGPIGLDREVQALALAVRLHVKRGHVDKAVEEMKVRPRLCLSKT